MEITGKAISIDEAATLLEGAAVTKEVKAGDLSAKWVKDSQGATSILVQGIGEQFIQFAAA